VEQLGADRILFGSDHPIADDYIDRAVAMLASEPFSEADREKITRLNAERFFSRAASA
jgi:predicted TIM-barrel fold metal-dependent hydrolase